MRLDSHQHFWIYTPEQYDWIDSDMNLLRQDFLPEELHVELTKNRIEGCIAVQACQTESETSWLLQLTETYPFVRGVVGWVDLCAANAAANLERLSQHPGLKGIRHVVQSEPDDRFLLREDFQNGVKCLGRVGLTYDLLIFPRQLPAAIEFVRKFPDQEFVLDHIAKPQIRSAVLHPWENFIREIAKSANLYCKVSGLVTEADWQAWKKPHFEPYWNVILEAFGPDRILYGSDWPVCKLAAEYSQVVDLAEQLSCELSIHEQAKFFGQNARKFYRIE